MTLRHIIAHVKNAHANALADDETALQREYIDQADADDPSALRLFASLLAQEADALEACQAIDEHLARSFEQN